MKNILYKKGEMTVGLGIAYGVLVAVVSIVTTYYTNAAVTTDKINQTATSINASLSVHGERISKVEADAANTDARLDRIENKIDSLLYNQGINASKIK